MPGTNAGTGQPITFRCTKCRRRASRSDCERRGTSGRGGFADDCELTGRERAYTGGNRGWFDMVIREYRCTTCGHVGWSRHPHLGLYGIR